VYHPQNESGFKPEEKAAYLPEKIKENNRFTISRALFFTQSSAYQPYSGANTPKNKFEF